MYEHLVRGKGGISLQRLSEDSGPTWRRCFGHALLCLGRANVYVRRREEKQIGPVFCYLDEDRQAGRTLTSVHLVQWESALLVHGVRQRSVAGGGRDSIRCSWVFYGH